MDTLSAINEAARGVAHGIAMGHPYQPGQVRFYDQAFDCTGLKEILVPAPTAEGTKHDHGKARMSLLDSSWLLGVAEVLTFGEKKYAANNWRKGISVSRLMDAAARHQASFNDGEDLDPESGKSHLYHASCCLMFASWMIKHRPDLDDRFKG